MKILLINDYHRQNGGAENYFFELKRRLKNTPHTDILSIGFSQEEESGNDFYTFRETSSKFKKLLWRFLPQPFLYYKLKKIIKQFNPDVIHVHNTRLYSATILKAIKTYPVMQTIHDHSLICPFGQNIHRDNSPCPTGIEKNCFWQHRLKFNMLIYFIFVLSFKTMQRHTRHAINHFITVSPGLEEVMKRHFPQPATYIPPFRLDNLPGIKPPQQNLRFLFAGLLNKQKGLFHLLNEFALAYKQNPDLYLSIAGIGPELVALKDFSNRLGLDDHIQFLGWQNPLDEHYQTHQAVIFPSIGLEGFPLIITEAMSFGRAVIGINRGTTSWLIKDRETGLLFDFSRKGDLASKIQILAEDIELATSMGIKGQQRISKLIDNDASLNKIMKTYQAIATPTSESLLLDVP